MNNDTTWSLGTLVAFPLFTLLAVVAAATAFFAFRYHRSNRGQYLYYDGGIFLGIAMTILAVGTSIGVAWSMWPYSAEYHQWRPVEGTVAQIDNRLIGNGDGMETKFVVTFDDGLGQYGCDDTRCASVRQGDWLSLSCKRAWQFTGTDGYDCRFFATEAKR